MIDPIQYPNEVNASIKIDILSAKVEELRNALNSLDMKQECKHVNSYITKRGTTFCRDCKRFIKKVA